MKLSIVTSLYYSAPYLLEFYQRIKKTAQNITEDIEIILVNDGSPDNVLDIAKEMVERDSRVKIIDLSKNFGHHKAIMTGLAHAQGDLIFQIDVDLEEEPELLDQFYQVYKEVECDVVYGVMDKRKGGIFERFSGWIFYSFLNLLTSEKIPPNTLMARLMSRRYVDNLLAHKESEFDIGGLWQITGFKQVPVIVHKHNKGTTTYSFYKRFKLAVKSVTAFSNRPLILIAGLGTLILFLAFLYFLYIMYVYLFVGKPPDGFTTIVLSIWFLGGLIVFCLGVIAIYLSVIFTETKNRPYTIIRDIYEKEG
jgi:putative glycosyltransferase